MSTKLKHVILSLGSVSVSIQGNSRLLDLQALCLLDVLLEKNRKEVKFSISGDPEDLLDPADLKEEKDESKLKAKTTQVSATYT